MDQGVCLKPRALVTFGKVFSFLDKVELFLWCLGDLFSSSLAGLKKLDLYEKMLLNGKLHVHAEFNLERIFLLLIFPSELQCSVKSFHMRLFVKCVM